MSRSGPLAWSRFLQPSFWLVFGSIWLLTGVVLTLAGVVTAVAERTWSDAIRTTGEVLVKEIVPADADSSTEYRVGFRFSTRDGTPVRGDQAVDVDAWERLVERDPIVVYYLEESPATARLSPDGDAVGAVIFLVVGVIVGGVGGTLVAREIGTLRRSRRLLRTGIAVVGNVTAIEPTAMSFNRRAQFRVTYSYRDSRGAKHHGDSGYLDWDDAAHWPVGARVAIRYDRDLPSSSVWEGDLDPDTTSTSVPPGLPD